MGGGGGRVWGGSGWGGGHNGCEQRIEAFVKIKKYIYIFWGGLGRGSGWGVRVDVNREVKFL